MNQPQNQSTHNGNPNKIKILVYHRIVDDDRIANSHWTCLHVREFRKHLELIERWGFTTITFHDYRLFLRGELNLPRKPVILTFDDGFAEISDLAFPALQNFGMKGVVFVVADRKIKSNIWERDLAVPRGQLLRRDQIIELAKEGFEIGSHSFSHPRLTELGEDDAWREISHSRLIIEDLIGSPLRSFSYPYGLVNENLKKMVRNAGYSIGCGVFSGSALFCHDLFELRRITMRNTTHSLRFALQLLTPYQRYEYLRWKTVRFLTNGHQNHNWQSRHIPVAEHLN
ncbi:MAG TPA: polysaccharide deacetylase family protein [Bacteroidota bacterium]|jgi:peptidoglycan/xylan/chitin deacetylase (PgdA/CDA1 family)|nr:polysaccharide deacetylase family protein [Bacteroidota bacterium]